MGAPRSSHASCLPSCSCSPSVPRRSSSPPADSRPPAGPEKPIAKTQCSEFPADNWWHADVSGLPVHARSAAWLSHMSTDVDLHPDFGPSYGDGPNYGIPITVVDKTHKKVKVSFYYGSESDKVRYPLGRDTRIEGGRGSDGDRHAIVVDKSRCKLYEVFDAREVDGRWTGGSGAVWSLKRHKLRPDGWTSADAAGLPILPGLLRWNEVKSDRIDHAIRFTTDETSNYHLWPARHHAGSTDDPNYPPMGARFRLKADVRRLGPLALRPARRRGDEEVRPGPRRQRLAVVLPGRAAPQVARPAHRGPQADPGLGVRRRRHLVAAGLARLGSGGLKPSG